MLMVSILSVELKKSGYTIGFCKSLNCWRYLCNPLGNTYYCNPLESNMRLLLRRERITIILSFTPLLLVFEFPVCFAVSLNYSIIRIRILLVAFA
jgi:hypothetical protein